MKRSTPTGVLKFLYRNLDQFRKKFIWILAAAVLAETSSFLILAALAEFTRIQPTRKSTLLLMATTIALYIIYLVFQRVVRWHGEALAGKFANHLLTKYFRRIEQIPADRLSEKHSGMLLSLTSKIAESMRGIIFSLFWELVPGLAVLALFIAFTIRASWIAGTLNILLLAVFVGIGVLLSRRMVPLSADLNLRQATLVETFVDLTSNIMTVKKLGLRKFASQRLQEKADHTATQIERVQKFHANRWFLLHSLYGAAYLGTVLIIAWQVMEGTTALSLLILLVGGYGSVRFLIERLSENIKDFMETRAYLRSLEDAVAGTSREPGTSIPWAQIRFTEVGFSYAGAVTQVRIPNFVLNAGERVCVTGTSGQGKSTFLSLLAGMLTAEQGTISVDGKAYGEVGQEFFDAHIATISQDTELFNVTLRENVALDVDISDGELVGYFEEFGLGGWLRRLECGLDTQVGEKGVKLSAGQRQRINLMRGLLLERSIYILDEPTSHLDADTERLVVDALRKRLHGKTAVIVTHRPALQKLCGQSFVMEDHVLVRAPARASQAV